MRLVTQALLCFFTISALAQTPVRLSWQEFARDPARLQSYRNAVAAMKALNNADPASVQFRQSWTYWANMHGYFGPQAKNGTVAEFRKNNDMAGAQYDAAFAGVVDMTPPDAVAKAVWDQCQHGTDYFFPWHRLYLHYFEQVLQKAANDPSLRLPYWDYTSAANLAMPAEFTSPTYTNAQGQVVDNPLYEARRDKGWNVPPGTRTLRAKDTDIDQTLDLKQLLNTVVNGKVTVKGYQPAIEQRPHGYTHCAVMGCVATVMGAVAYSANDPIFYIHHANIDRLWDCWTSIPGHVNPGAPWTAQTFSYVDANGAQVSNRVGDVFKPGFIDYVYEQPSNCKRTKAAPIVMSAKATASVRSAHATLAAPLLIGEETADLAVDAPLVRRRVTLPATASLVHPREFALRDQEQLPIAIDLTLRGVQFGKHPNAEFRVYLQRTDSSQEPQFVGTISFFSQGATGSAHAHHHHAVTTDDWTFDVTEELRALRLEGTGTLAVNVIVEVEEEDREEFDPAAARVVIDEIEFHVRRDL